MTDDVFSGGGLWLFAILALMWGGNGFGFGNNGLANAIGYENLATSNEVQRGFDNQNAMANQREILSAVTNGTAQAVAATNQAFHDNLNVIQDKYGDMSHITTDASTILKYAISELTDDDFPFYPASQRAYCWLKKHIEKDLERGE